MPNAAALQFLGSCNYNGSLGIVMELCACDLHSAIADGKVSWGPKCALQWICCLVLTV